MAVGTINTNRESDISPQDLDMFYTFSSSREENSNQVFRLTPTDVLEPLLLPSDEQVTNEENLLGGMFNLTLPATIFNEIGFYTIFIRGKQTRTTIVDCGVLSALPSVKGIVLDINSLPTELTANNALQGFRIEYINTDGTKLRNTVRYVVTSNKVVPVTENIGNTSQSSVRYRFDDSGTLLFLQLTPSSASNVKPNVDPFIGNPDQTILLNNALIDPLAIEVEFVENTLDTITDIIVGNQIRDVQKGIVTYYNQNNEILKQLNLFEIDDDITNTTLFEVKQLRETIDPTQDFDDIVDSVNE